VTNRSKKKGDDIREEEDTAAKTDTSGRRMDISGLYVRALRSAP